MPGKPGGSGAGVGGGVGAFRAIAGERGIEVMEPQRLDDGGAPGIRIVRSCGEGSGMGEIGHAGREAPNRVFTHVDRQAMRAD